MAATGAQAWAVTWRILAFAAAVLVSPLHPHAASPEGPWEPRLALEVNAASGDSGHGMMGTFNAMYPRLP